MKKVILFYVGFFITFSCFICRAYGLSAILTGIYLNSLETKAYIVNNHKSTVSVCQINSESGDLVGCHDTGSGFSGPYSIVLNSSDTRAYITNQSKTSSSVSFCQVTGNENPMTASGDLKNCKHTGSGFSIPHSIKLNASETKAYITNVGNHISVCTIAPSGELTNCKAAETTIDNPVDIQFFSAGTKAFISSTDERVYFCSINKTWGGLSNRVIATGDISFPRDMVLNKSESIIYITNPFARNIVMCQINKTSGKLFKCRTFSSPYFSDPYSIVLSLSGKRAYITNLINKTVALCSVNESTHELTYCIQNVIIPVTFASLHTEHYVTQAESGTLTIKNSGDNQLGFYIKIPPAYANYFPVSSQRTCPVSAGTSGLSAGESCKLLYKIPADATNKVIPLTDNANGPLELIVSSLTVRRSNQKLMPLSKLMLYKNSKGVLVFSTSRTITGFKISLSKNIMPYFSGPCLTTTKLKKGLECKLTYALKNKQLIKGVIDVTDGNSNKLIHVDIYLSPTWIVTLNSNQLTQYNRSEITIKNQDSIRIEHVYYHFVDKDIKVITSNCSDSLGAKRLCQITLIPITNGAVKNTDLFFGGDGLIPYKLPLTIKPVPTTSIKVNNRGGYIMRAYYPSVSGNKIRKFNTGNFTSPATRKMGHIPVLNDIKDLPGSVLPQNNIYVSVYGSVRHPRLPLCQNGNITCTRATVNATCYYTNSSCKK